MVGVGINWSDEKIIGQLLCLFLSLFMMFRLPYITDVDSVLYLSKDVLLLTVPGNHDSCIFSCIAFRRCTIYITIAAPTQNSLTNLK